MKNLVTKIVENSFDKKARRSIFSTIFNSSNSHTRKNHLRQYGLKNYSKGFG